MKNSLKKKKVEMAKNFHFEEPDM